MKAGNVAEQIKPDAPRIPFIESRREVMYPIQEIRAPDVAHHNDEHNDAKNLSFEGIIPLEIGEILLTLFARRQARNCSTS